MKKLMTMCVLLVAALAGTAQAVTDPNAEVREAKDFHAIHVSSAFDVYLTQGNSEAVAVSASEEKFKNDIIVEVKAGILYIRFNSKGLRWSTGNKKLKAYISFKKINSLKVSGACDVMISGTLKAEDLAIDLSGASDLKGTLNVNKLAIELSGASDMTVSGNATQMLVDANGASNFKGYDLVTDICDVTVSGASDIRITVNKELSAQASGASDIKYKGNGVIRNLKTSGASSVSRG